MVMVEGMHGRISIRSGGGRRKNEDEAWGPCDTYDMPYRHTWRILSKIKTRSRPRHSRFGGWGSSARHAKQDETGGDWVWRMKPPYPTANGKNK